MHQALIQQQVGWMKCVACSDSKLRPGMMHVRDGQWVQCPACQGKAVVPQVKIFNPLTGREIDYERQQ
jgi:NAD-dependent SIR2 family protein deacetylase